MPWRPSTIQPVPVAELDPLFVARQIHTMEKLEVGYVSRYMVGPDKGASLGGSPDALYLDGRAAVLTSKDLQTSSDKGGAMNWHEEPNDFFRIICLGAQTVKISKGSQIRANTFALDLTHLALGENVVVQDKLSPVNWAKRSRRGGKLQPITIKLGTMLDLDRFEDDYRVWNQKAAQAMILDGMPDSPQQETSATPKVEINYGLPENILVTMMNKTRRRK